MTDKPILRGTERDERGRFTDRNQASLKHGLYSAMRAGSMRGRRTLNKRLGELRTALEQAVTDSPQRRVLIGQVVRTEGLIEIIEAYFRRAGILDEVKARRGKLEPQPILAKTYLGLLNSQRLALAALGLDGKKPETPDIMAYVKAFDKAKAAKAVPIGSLSSGNEGGEKVAR